MMYDGNMLGKVLALSTLCAFALLSALMQSTSPSTIHPLGILVVFILLYIVALGVSTFFVFWVHKLYRRFVRSPKTSREFNLKTAYLYASVIALAPVMFAGISSIGHTSVYEVLLIVLFECIACFYITKQRS